MKKIYILAALLALITAGAAYFFLNSLEEKAKPQEIPTTTIVVAASDIGESVFITDDMVKLCSIPTDFLPAGAVTEIGDVIGMVNMCRCVAGQPILADQLGSTEDAGITEGGRLSYALPDGMRAMTVYITEVTGVAGYVNAGDRVDIVCTMVEKEKDAAGEDVSIPTARMLLENVSVLQTGIITAQLAATDGETKQEIYTSLTLAVKPEDAVKLQYAVTYGEITLLLRAVDDTESVKLPEYVGERAN